MTYPRVKIFDHLDASVPLSVEVDVIVDDISNKEIVCMTVQYEDQDEDGNTVDHENVGKAVEVCLCPDEVEVLILRLRQTSETIVRNNYT